MLRIAAVLLLVILSVGGCTGSFTRISNSEKTISTRGEVPGQTQEQLFGATKVWMEENFAAVENPIVDEDYRAAIVVGKGQIDYPCSMLGCLTKSDWKVSFMMKVRADSEVIETTFWNVTMLSAEQNQEALYQQGMASPVWSERDMNAIRPMLLELHSDLLRTLRHSAY